MDYLRVLLVPFRPTGLILIGVFALVFTLLEFAGLVGLIVGLLVQVWILKYGYVVIEHIADGASEPPVMDDLMLSPTEVRPWIQLGLMVGGAFLCKLIGGNAGIALAVVLLILLPATTAVLGMGEPFFQAINPLMLFRVIRGLGPWYLLILLSIVVYAGILLLLARFDIWRIAWHAAGVVCELSFFSLIGGCIYLRRRQLGFEPRQSPERTAAREEAERVKLRARMIDEVFQQVRIGKHVEATRPLAKWLSALDGEIAARDALFIAGQALGWEAPGGLNTLASTLIRHLLRAGRPDAALAVFERLRQGSPTLTLDSPEDLRFLAEYAESTGRTELAVSMRLETPIYRPQPR